MCVKARRDCFDNNAEAGKGDSGGVAREGRQRGFADTWEDLRSSPAR